MPPGPSKNAGGRWSAEKRARTASTSKATVLIGPDATRLPSGHRAAPSTPPRERLDRGDGTGLGRPWHVIVLNDDHNTFQGVAFALSSVVPGVDYDGGLRLADQIHGNGLAIVWSGDARAGGAVLGAAARLRADAGPARDELRATFQV